MQETPRCVVHVSFFIDPYVISIELRERKRDASEPSIDFKPCQGPCGGYCPRWGRTARLGGAEPLRTPSCSHCRASIRPHSGAPGPRGYGGNPAGGTRSAPGRAQPPPGADHRVLGSAATAPPASASATPTNRPGGGGRGPEDGPLGIRRGPSDHARAGAGGSPSERLADRVLTDLTRGLGTV
jgi:hypothetical protein